MHVQRLDFEEARRHVDQVRRMRQTQPRYPTLSAFDAHHRSAHHSWSEEVTDLIHPAT